MTGLPSRIYDTSALVRASNMEKGHDAIKTMLQQSKVSAIKDKASVLTAFEFLFLLGRKSGRSASGALALLREIIDFIPTDYETSNRAAFLRLKYRALNLSMADAIILQTGIDNGFEVITSDKEWTKVSEAKVKIV